MKSGTGLLVGSKGTVTRYLFNTPGSGSPASSRIYPQSTLSGAAIGTAAGGIVGAIAGHTGIGLAVGEVAGTAGGYLIITKKPNKKLTMKPTSRVTRPARRANR